MHWKVYAAGLCAAVIAVTAVASAPAEAAAKKKQRVVRHSVVVTSRAPARLTVPARSFLDGGTEVAPGERKFMDYAIPPGYSPMGVIENTSAYHRSPLPGPFDLTGRHNPWPWSW